MLAKKWDFSFFLKVGREQLAHLRDDGKEFQAHGAEIANARGLERGARKPWNR